jgi:hypothetical protein
MKVAPVSADLLVKLGLAGAVLLAGAYALHKVAGLVTAPGALNPADPRNLAYSAVNSIGGAIVTDPAGAGKNADGSWSLGGALFDILNPSTAEAVKGMSGPVVDNVAAPREDYSTWNYF